MLNSLMLNSLMLKSAIKYIPLSVSLLGLLASILIRISFRHSVGDIAGNSQSSGPSGVKPGQVVGQNHESINARGAPLLVAQVSAKSADDQYDGMPGKTLREKDPPPHQGTNMSDQIVKTKSNLRHVSQQPKNNQAAQATASSGVNNSNQLTLGEIQDTLNRIRKDVETSSSDSESSSSYFSSSESW